MKEYEIDHDTFIGGWYMQVKRCVIVWLTYLIQNKINW